MAKGSGGAAPSRVGGKKGSLGRTASSFMRSYEQSTSSKVKLDLMGSLVKIREESGRKSYLGKRIARFLNG
jgi:hypothetical protein